VGKKINFTKMNGTGNDFIIFDNRTGLFTGNESDYFKKGKIGWFKNLLTNIIVFFIINFVFMDL